MHVYKHTQASGAILASFGGKTIIVINFSYSVDILDAEFLLSEVLEEPD